MFSTAFCASPLSLLVVFFVICGLEAAHTPPASPSAAEAADPFHDLYIQSVIPFQDQHTGLVTAGCVTTYQGATTVFVPWSTSEQIQPGSALTTANGNQQVIIDSGPHAVIFKKDQLLVGLRVANQVPPILTASEIKGERKKIIAATLNNGKLVTVNFQIINAQFCGLEPGSGSDVRRICAVSSEPGNIDVGKGFPLFIWQSGKLFLLGIQTEYLKETGYNLFAIPN